MARAARLSGQEDEEFEELEEELHSKKVSSPALIVALHAVKALWSEALLISCRVCGPVLSSLYMTWYSVSASLASSWQPQ